MNSVLNRFPRLLALTVPCTFVVLSAQPKLRQASAFENSVDTEGESYPTHSDAEGAFIPPPEPSEIPSLISLLNHSDTQVRCRAARRLSAAGPQAVAALPQLLDLAGTADAETRISIAAALTSIAPGDARVLAALIQLVDYDDCRVEAAAIVSLREIGKPAKSAVPTLIAKVIRDYRTIDEYGSPASLAIGTFGDIGPPAKDAVPLLARILADEERTWGARRDAADSLGKIGPGAIDATSVLTNALVTNDITVENTLFGAGTVLNGRTLGDATVDIRFSAARALGRIGPAAKKSVPELTKALTDRASVPISARMESDDAAHVISVRWTVCAAAAKSLGQIGSAAKPALPRLMEILAEDAVRDASGISMERLSVAGAVALLDKTAHDARQVVASGLKSNDPYTRSEAAALLGQIGFREEHIMANLEKVAREDKYRDVRCRARRALRAIKDVHPRPLDPVPPKNSIRGMYQRKGHTSNWGGEGGNGHTEADDRSRIRLFHHYSRTGSDEPAGQADAYDHAAREYR